MRITKGQLRRIIKEEYYSGLSKDHIDGHPWSGSLEDLAIAQAGTWGHGGVVDPLGYEAMINTSVDLSLGKGKSILKLSEKHLRRIIREAVTLLERGEVNVSQIKKYEPEIREWVETLVDSMADNVDDRIKEMDDKSRKNVIDGVTKATVLELISQFGHVTAFEQQRFDKQDTDKKYEEERRRRSRGAY